MAGKWIAVEGGDGSGKSTQCACLAERLDALMSAEPGGTQAGRDIAELLLWKDRQPGLSLTAEMLLFAADRAQHVFEVVVPALNSGRHVVSSRSVWSSMAYQTARGVPERDVFAVNEVALAGVWPDVVVYIDVDPELTSGRVAGRGTLDRLERQGDGLQFEARRRFLKFAAADPDRWLVVDGSRRVEDVTAQILEGLAGRGVVQVSR